ncbi:MAG: ATP-binding protein [Pseudomonadota bacterium]
MNINRSIFNRLYGEKSEPEISILLGARQVGKTTLLHQLEAKFKMEGASTRFYDLESSADLEELSGTNKEVFEKITGSGDVIFIDEFHYLKNASKIFKQIYDSKSKIKVYASGSSSLEIHKHLKESLAGRFRKTMIYPLSMEESKQIPKEDLREFLKWGGMPGLIHRKTDDDKMNLLENIVSTYVTKDIKALIKEENVRAFNSMLYSIAQNQGSLAVAANISRDAGISESTVANYLEIMSQTYVCHLIHSYSKNLANELKKSRKCYLFDIGIRNSLLKDFSYPNEREDKGTVYETFVLLHLIQQLKPNMELRFWRTKKGAEVDFILLVNRQPTPIEVKSDLKEASIPAGMISFMNAYPKILSAYVFNNTIRQDVHFNGRTVHFCLFEDIVDFVDKKIAPTVT